MWPLKETLQVADIAFQGLETSAENGANGEPQLSSISSPAMSNATNYAQNCRSLIGAKLTEVRSIGASFPTPLDVVHCER